MSEDNYDRVAAILAENGRTMRSLEETVAKMLPLAIKANDGSRTNNKATITQTDRTPMWICVVIVFVMATALVTTQGNKNQQAVVMQASINDLKAENRQRQNDIADLRATDNAVRAYINTGILKPKAEAAKAGTGK